MKTMNFYDLKNAMHLNLIAGPCKRIEDIKPLYELLVEERAKVHAQIWQLALLEDATHAPMDIGFIKLSLVRLMDIYDHDIALIRAYALQTELVLHD